MISLSSFHCWRWAAVLVIMAFPGISAISNSTSTFSYFDDLRNDLSISSDVFPTWVSTATEEGSSVIELQSGDGQAIRLVDITVFLPFSESGVAREETHNDAAVALLAAHHFNQRSAAVVSGVVESCNIYMTLDLQDTQFSPIAATSLFTQDILYRPHTLQEPLPAAVVGAYRSATTSPLAILTGVNGIPQISYSSTSSDFDVKEQYPTFGRTIGNSETEAQVALSLFQSWNATHVGVLFVTDAFGSSLQNALQGLAASAGITVNPIAFSFAASYEEIRSAVATLKASEYRLVYAICFDTHVESLLQAAAELEVVGDDFVWVFPGVSSSGLINSVQYPTGSSLAYAFTGVGLLEYAGGYVADPWIPGEDRVPALSANPTSGFERFRTAWRQSLDDEEWVAHVRSKYPASLMDDSIAQWNPDASFLHEPGNFAPYVYDAVMSLGLAMCQSGSDTDTFVSGTEIYDSFLETTNFEGASGVVTVNNSTGTREYHPFLLSFVEEYDTQVVDGTDTTRFAIQPSQLLENGTTWVTHKEFVFPDGTLTPPKSLPRVQHDYNYIGGVGRAIGYTLLGVMVVSCVTTWVWIFSSTKERVVVSAQPIFLFMISVGVLIMSLTIIPLGMDEEVISKEGGLNAACMSIPWLYVTGVIICNASLFAKTRAMYQAFSNPEMDFVIVSVHDVLSMLGVLAVLNVTVMCIWTVVSPMVWEREIQDSTDKFGRPLESFGACTSADGDNSLPYVSILIVINLLSLVLANFWAYKTRNIDTDYHESRYLAIAMASVLQAWCMGIPILIMVTENPQAKYYVSVGIVFVTSAALLYLVFIPKIVAVFYDRKMAVEESKKAAFKKVAQRTVARKRQEGWGDEASKALDASPERKLSTVDFSGSMVAAASIPTVEPSQITIDGFSGVMHSTGSRSQVESTLEPIESEEHEDHGTSDEKDES
eukprot:Nitzschia sp. Nitz4//scaffold306_size21755//18232//21199//NITZ4_008592-RA/size21755-processed-gene-0.29-mRNA-1//-1//CDS//3329547120//717//frame0